MKAYYNENDPRAAAWLRELIKAGLIAPGDVDERSITEVQPDDLKPYAQCHFFAGIGGWSYALRLAGVRDDEPIWTGSCPCQPWSHAGDGLGELDPRNLWPDWFKLIEKRGPAIIIGEQVASKAALRWLDGVFANLEGEDYACAAADLCAAGVNAPQLRQRLYWTAYSNRERFSRREESNLEAHQPEQQTSRRDNAMRCGDASRMGDPDRQGSQRRSLDRNSAGEWSPWTSSVGVCGIDGKWRRIEPSIPPVAARLPSRVALIRGSGNAIVPQVAEVFIRAAFEAINH